MFSTVMGELSVAEGQGPGEVRFIDLYTPLAPEEEWPAGREPTRAYASSEELPYPIKLCRSFEQQGEETKRLVCVLEGNYIARQVREAWSIEDAPILNDATLDIRDLVLKPDNPSNDHWIATDKGLINIRNGQAKTLSVMSTGEGLPSDDIRALTLDEQGNLYVGTTRGLVSLNISLNLPEDLTQTDWTEIAPESRLLRSTIYALARSASGALWIGLKAGAARWVADELTIYTLGATLPGAPVTSIATSGERVALSHPSGVSLYNGAWSHYGARAGVYQARGQMLTDDRGVIWTLSDQGVIGFPNSTNAPEMP